MTELLSIEKLKEILNYRDNRAVKRWLNCKGIAIMKLGKSYCILENSFNDVIDQIARNSAGNSIKQERYKPKGKNEKEYLSRLAKTISEL